MSKIYLFKQHLGNIILLIIESYAKIAPTFADHSFCVGISDHSPYFPFSALEIQIKYAIVPTTAECRMCQIHLFVFVKAEGCSNGIVTTREIRRRTSIMSV